MCGTRGAEGRGCEGVLLRGAPTAPRDAEQEIDSQGLSGSAAPRDQLNVTGCRRDTAWAAAFPELRAELREQPDSAGITPWHFPAQGPANEQVIVCVSETSELFPKEK